MWMNLIHNCLSPGRTAVIAFLDLRQPVWGPSLALEDMAEFLFSHPGALTFMWQLAPKGGEVWCSSPPSLLPLSPFPLSSITPSKPSQDKCTMHMGGRRRPLCTLYSQYLPLDSLKLNGCKCSWSVSTCLGDSDIGRFFPVLPLTFLLCLSLLRCSCL